MYVLQANWLKSEFANFIFCLSKFLASGLSFVAFRKREEDPFFRCVLSNLPVPLPFHASRIIN